MRKKILPVAAALILIVIVAIIGVISKVVEKYTPTDETVTAEEYFGITQSDEVGVILQDEIAEYKGLNADGIMYLNLQAVKDNLNSRFYWDEKEQVMVYTTPTDIIKIPADQQSYTVSGKEETADYVIVRTDDGGPYIAADFVQKYTNMEYTVFENPTRMLITYKWGEITYADIRKQDFIRREAGIKSVIIATASRGDKVAVLGQQDEWSKVRTEDGFIGYIPNKKLGDAYQETITREFEEPNYTSLKQESKVNLVWHQITNMDSNYNLVYDIADMTGVNTISPTWFSISSNSGDISSLAYDGYVTEAHEKGLKVWGLIDNFSTEVDTATVLNSTSARENLTNQLIAAAIQYKLDGINVDFESLTEDAAEGYVQFMRELSVKCRNNSLVLSVDVPVPMPYTQFYNRGELGTVADYVIIMGYDEHYVGSEEGSVASLAFEETGIQDTLKEVSADKIISGIPFYTRLWKIDSKGEVSSEAIGMDTADEYMTGNNVTTNWSEETSQDYGEYQDSEGNTYKIWLENEASIAEKVKLVKEYNLAGVAAWKLGFERASIWEVITTNMQ